MTHVNTDPHAPSDPAFQPTLELTDCQIDLATGAVRTRGGATRQLRALERDVLAYLVDRVGETVTQAELLHEVWGYDNVVTRTVYTTIRRLRQQIEADPTSPAHIVTQRGEGYQFVPARVQNVPLPTLIGRQAEIERIRERLSAGDRLITVSGPAGIGKTALANYLAATSEVPATVVELSTVRTLAALVSAVAQGLGLHPAGPGDAAERLGEQLGCARPSSARARQRGARGGCRGHRDRRVASGGAAGALCAHLPGDVATRRRVCGGARRPQRYVGTRVVGGAGDAGRANAGPPRNATRSCPWWTICRAFR